MAIKRYFSNAPWEKKVGYCRALRHGVHIAVTGTTSLNHDGSIFAKGQAYKQTKRCLELIERALQELGAKRDDIIRTRLFVTDIMQWEEYGRAHAEFFADQVPTTSMIEIKGLIHPDMLIEIEADAICSGSIC